MRIATRARVRLGAGATLLPRDVAVSFGTGRAPHLDRDGDGIACE
ncbi:MULTISPECIES: excalibur calcium-binding domain-containing protein [Nocardia]